jgi:hypothetical protein
LYLDGQNEEMDQSAGPESDDTHEFDETLLLKSISFIRTNAAHALFSSSARCKQSTHQ